MAHATTARRSEGDRRAIAIMRGDYCDAYVYESMDPVGWHYVSWRWGHAEQVYPTRHAAVVALRQVMADDPA